MAIKLFRVYIIFIFIYPFLKSTQVNHVIPNATEEILTICFAPYILLGLKQILKIGKEGRTFIFSLSLYLLIGIISSIFGGINPKNILMQFLIELKLPIVVSLFFAFSSKHENNHLLKQTVVALIILSCLLAVSQLMIAPYSNKIMINIDWIAITHGTFLDIVGIKNRAYGLFQHPARLAFISSVFFIYYLLLLTKQNLRKNIFPIVLLFFLLISAQQQHETIAIVVITLALWWNILKINNNFSLPINPFLYQALNFFFFCFLFSITDKLTDYVVFLIKNFQLNAFSEATLPRIVYLKTSFLIANSHFPLGGGLGSFGGHAAITQGSQYYTLYGFDNLWWFSQGKYLYDNFWAHIIGESGWLGFSLYCTSIFSLILMFKRLGQQDNNNRVYYLALSQAFIFGSIVSIVTPVFLDIFSIATMSFFLLFIEKQTTPRITKETTCQLLPK